MGDFSERITILWQRDGGSKNAFAQRCGISWTLLNKYLKGSRPRSDRLRELAERLGVTVEWLSGAGDASSSHTKVSKHTAPTEQTDALLTEALDLTKAVSSAIVACHEVGALSALDLICRDQRALIGEIRRLYPEVTQAPSAEGVRIPASSGDDSTPPPAHPPTPDPRRP